MSSLKQIQANRLNAQHSTGPRSPEGKAAVRFNALKTGIDAQSQVIPGENPAALALLAAEYYDRYQPATTEVRALVDALITAEWLQRRFRALEAQLWQYDIQDLRGPVEGFEVAQVYDRESGVFNRLQRRIDAAERTYHRTLAALQKIESSAPQPTPPPPDSEPAPPPNPKLKPDQSLNPEIGFVPPEPLGRPIPPLPVASSGPLAPGAPR
jgi:hypothetical protein